MKRLILVPLFVVLLLAGCSAIPPEPASQTPLAPTPAPSAPAPASSAAQVPAPAEQSPETARNMTAPLVPYKSDVVGVSFSYPEHLNQPELAQPQTLRLDFGNGELYINRQPAKPGKSLSDLAAASIEASTQASSGRIVARNLGQQTLGGEAAWGIQQYFDSAAGRYDAVGYLVLKGEFQYGITCRTKPGPPVIAWEDVEPVCRRILDTIKFEP